MAILVTALGFGLVCLLLIEGTPPAWRKAIGGFVLIAALLLGFAPDP